MVAASPVPTIIAGMTLRARREIAAHFFVHHAISADDAVAYVPDRPITLRQFERMQGKGVIRQAGPGRYWIDTAAYQADRDARRRRLVPIVLLLVLIAAAIPLFFYKG